MIDSVEQFAEFATAADQYERGQPTPARGFFGRLLDHGYQLMGRRLLNVFDRQRANVLDRLRGLFIRRMGTATNLIPGVDAIYEREHWDVETRAAAYGVLEQLVLNGSNVELETAAGARIRQLARLSHDVQTLARGLPVKVRRGIDEGLAEAMDQPYWAELNDEMRQKLREQLAEA